MDPQRRALLTVGIFVGLLAFHVWILYRMVNAGNVLLASLLVVAIGLFAWRILHYWGRYRGIASGRVTEEPQVERRRIYTMVPVLAALLVLHAWLITLTLAAGEVAFTILLLLAVAVFVSRLGFYAWRFARLRRGPS